MKSTYQVLLLCLMVITSVTCCGQAIMQSTSDISKIKSDEGVYLGKPLSFFLKNIKLPIVSVRANQRRSMDEAPGHFFFQFNTPEELDSIRRSGGYPVGIVVYVKEPFSFDYASRFRNKNLSWTAEDSKKYGYLTVERLRFFTGKKDD